MFTTSGCSVAVCLFAFMGVIVMRKFTSPRASVSFSIRDSFKGIHLKCYLQKRVAKNRSSMASEFTIIYIYSNMHISQQTHARDTRFNNVASYKSTTLLQNSFLNQSLNLLRHASSYCIQ